jgi:hypothetical protein
MGSRLLTTAVGLVTLTLAVVQVTVQPSTYFQPNILLQWLSFLPLLGSFVLGFSFTVPKRDLEKQSMHAPVATHVTLPNLRWFAFDGGRSYTEAVLHRITAPRLETFNIKFLNQLTLMLGMVPEASLLQARPEGHLYRK